MDTNGQCINKCDNFPLCKPCGEIQDCKYQNESTFYCECDNQVSKKDVSGTLYCINCEYDICKAPTQPT